MLYKIINYYFDFLDKIGIKYIKIFETKNNLPKMNPLLKSWICISTTPNLPLIYVWKEEKKIRNEFYSLRCNQLMLSCLSLLPFYLLCPANGNRLSLSHTHTQWTTSWHGFFKERNYRLAENPFPSEDILWPYYISYAVFLNTQAA